MPPLIVTQRGPTVKPGHAARRSPRRVKRSAVARTIAGSTAYIVSHHDAAVIAATDANEMGGHTGLGPLTLDRRAEDLDDRDELGARWPTMRAAVAACITPRGLRHVRGGIAMPFVCEAAQSQNGRRRTCRTRRRRATGRSSYGSSA